MLLNIYLNSKDFSKYIIIISSTLAYKFLAITLFSNLDILSYLIASSRPVTFLLFFTICAQPYYFKPLNINFYRIIIFAESFICFLYTINLPFRFFCRRLWADGIIRDVTYRFFGLQKGFDSFSVIVLAWLIGYIEILLNKKNKNTLSLNLDIFLILFTLIFVLVSARIAVLMFLIY